MRFLIDNALSPLVAEGLCVQGYDAIHVRDLSLQDASDNEFFSQTYAEQRIIISADTDFGTLLARWQQATPSVILFRRATSRNKIADAPLLQLGGPLDDAQRLGRDAGFETGGAGKQIRAIIRAASYWRQAAAIDSKPFCSIFRRAIFISLKPLRQRTYCSLLTIQNCTNIR